MANLFNYEEYGYKKCLDFIIEKDGENLIITFTETYYTDKNKWNEKNVLTDVFVNKFTLCDVYTNADPNGEHLEEYILKNKDNFEQMINEVNKLSEDRTKIQISLPTNSYPHRRGAITYLRTVKNVFSPLIVKVNDKDVSNDFRFFYQYGSKAVNMAYNALIKGEKLDIKDDLADTTPIEQLHESIK